jgi:CRP-like cAMP-binding protein
MLSALKESLARFTFLTPTDLVELASIAKLRTLRRDEHLVQEGQYYYSAVTVVKGLLRHYILDPKGFDRTLIFVPEGRQTAMMDCIFNDVPAKENIVALEDSILITVDVREFDRIAANNLRLMRLQNQSLRDALRSNIEQTRVATMLRPHERYAHFRSTFPDLDQRVKQKNLSSYLGITPTSLSRLRARRSRS